MTTIDPKAPVLVTGATGYVAGRLVETLLSSGHTVHATVRNPGDRAKLEPLELVAKGLPGSLRFFRADLMELGSFAEAMTGCEPVFHTASPFITKARHRDSHGAPSRQFPIIRGRNRRSHPPP